MASSAREIQLNELRDTISQLKETIAEQNELIRSLRDRLDEKTNQFQCLSPAKLNTQKRLNLL